MTRFTVVGAAGYLGRHLSAHLRAQGRQVWAPQRAGADDCAAWLGRPLGHVLYCAGVTGDFRARAFDAMDAHTGLLCTLLRRARFDSLLYLSSTRVYLGAASGFEDAPLRVQPGDPEQLYNLSKLAGEALCHAGNRARAPGLAGLPRVRIARLSNVVGPAMDATSGLPAELLHQARSGHLLLRSDPRSARDYLHLADLLHWLPRIALTGRAPLYNLASGVQTSHAQWLAWLQRRTGCTLQYTQGASLQSLPPISVQRLQAEWPHRPRCVFDDALLTTGAGTASARAQRPRP